MMKPKRKRNEMIVIIIIAILVLALIGFVISFLLTSEKGTDKQLDVSNIATTAKQEGRNLQEEITVLNKKYEDAIIWLRIPGTSIDTSVFQGKDNTRYLRNDRDNAETKWGENFLDYRNNIASITQEMQHMIIYGHNTEIDTRFTALLNYKEKEFFKNHKKIELSTKDGNYTFEIFAAYQTDTTFYYIDTKFESVEEYGTYIQTLKDKSNYNTDVNISKEDTVLTLSTCDYSIPDGRFVIHAKLVKN